MSPTRLLARAALAALAFCVIAVAVPRHAWAQG